MNDPLSKSNILAYKIYLKVYYLLKLIESQSLEDTTTYSLKAQENSKSKIAKEISTLKQIFELNLNLNQKEDTKNDAVLTEQLEIIFLLRTEKSILLSELKKLQDEIQLHKNFACDVIDFADKFDITNIPMAKISLIEIKQSFENLAIEKSSSSLVNFSLNDRIIHNKILKPHFDRMKKLSDEKNASVERLFECV